MGDEQQQQQQQRGPGARAMGWMRWGGMLFASASLQLQSIACRASTSRLLQKGIPATNTATAHIVAVAR